MNVGAAVGCFGETVFRDMLMETVQNQIIIGITESCLFKPYHVCSKNGSDPTAESYKP